MVGQMFCRQPGMQSSDIERLVSQLVGSLTAVRLNRDEVKSSSETIANFSYSIMSLQTCLCAILCLEKRQCDLNADENTTRSCHLMVVTTSLRRISTRILIDRNNMVVV